MVVVGPDAGPGPLLLSHLRSPSRWLAHRQWGFQCFPGSSLPWTVRQQDRGDDFTFLPPCPDLLPDL